jgi:hypothetical protein
MEQIIGLLGLIGLIGLAGLWGIKQPVDKSRPGGTIRLLALLGLLGFAGFWINGAGAAGAFGAIGLWNHQEPKLAFWGKLGWLGVIGLPLLARAMF